MLSIDHRFVAFAASAASFAVDTRKEEKKTRLFCITQYYLGTSLTNFLKLILEKI